MTDTKTNKNLIERPPVVVIMGHIDHGKSTLLDFIRHSNVVAGEAGSITQHLGAYEVEHERNGETKKITFIDTPGHEAFKSVRSRGADVADVAVLIVSAEDGVMPQTLEALEAIKKSNVPFVVAINKIDTPKANVEKTKNSLVENEIYLEGYGGDIAYAEISAITGENIEDLLDVILLSAEMEEYKGDPSADAEGNVVESHKDKFTGITTTLVIKNGTLKQGQFVVSCDAYSPVRLMKDHNGKQIKEATFSTPVSVSGWNKIPKVGYEFTTFDTKKEAEKFCESFDENEKKKQAEVKENKISSEFGKIRKAEDFLVPIIIKADTDGSLEAILYELNKVESANENNNAQTKIISTSTGNISENDLKLASSHGNTIVVGFGVDIDKQAEIMADRLEIKTNTFDIIYELTEWLMETIEENRPRMEIEERRGLAKVLKVFNKVRNNQILGGKVKEGVVATGNKFRVLRRGEEVGTGIIKGLQQQKSSATEISEGTEFGTSVDAKIEIAAGDEIEVYEIVKK
jgi:translation initiation factor IF-2